MSAIQRYFRGGTAANHLLPSVLSQASGKHTSLTFSVVAGERLLLSYSPHLNSPHHLLRLSILDSQSSTLFILHLLQILPLLIHDSRVDTMTNNYGWDQCEPIVKSVEGKQLRVGFKSQPIMVFEKNKQIKKDCIDVNFSPDYIWGHKLDKTSIDAWSKSYLVAWNDKHNITPPQPAKKTPANKKKATKKNKPTTTARKSAPTSAVSTTSTSSTWSISSASSTNSTNSTRSTGSTTKAAAFNDLCKGEEIPERDLSSIGLWMQKNLGFAAQPPNTLVRQMSDLVRETQTPFYMCMDFIEWGEKNTIIRKRKREDEALEEVERQYKKRWGSWWAEAGIPL
ncbi:unnamed protein product [Periconia digitata]|uniref:Uncharacterized protein n=1 Tax=Periconia digitata TaxID=1303443 RepID=A0A9W4U305_9PLEO|nr:unnamed protein product [Periconia digitata]